jgi:uncharacterized membrane protein YeaQ/YmgE (transglycosylase-associated protein family)
MLRYRSLDPGGILHAHFAEATKVFFALFRSQATHVSFSRHSRGSHMRGIDPIAAFILIVVIGVVAGMLFDRFAGPSWLARQFGGQRSQVTSSLVGVAGSFLGYHLAALGGMIGLGGYAVFVGAVVGAAVVLLLWRMIR